MMQQGNRAGTLAEEDIERVFDDRFVAGNKATLLWKDNESFGLIFDAMRRAEELICLEFYIFRNDETGTELAALLKQKAAQGVRVYLLYDHFGSWTTPVSFWRDLRAHGIEVRASRPFRWTSPLYYVHRDHTKLIIIDGVRAFTGGLNIANEYRGYHLLKMKRHSGWRDTGIFLEGPVAGTLLDRFRLTWSFWKGGPIVSDSPAAPVGGGVSVLPIFTHSAQERRKFRKLLYYSINSAHQGINLTTAYFTPSRRMVQVLEEAVSRGVEVKLLLPGRSDIIAAHYAGRAFFTRLLRAGVRIFTYNGVILHAKTAVFDGVWSIIGSANLDFQSLRRNDEGNVGIAGGEFGRRMLAVFEEDLTKSEELVLERWLKRPLHEKIQEYFFALFRRRL
ncbi:MAG: phospholipase D-like domain-containing protein [Thermodesulfovibrionales bacterium]